VPAILYELEKQVQYDRYFLFDIDVPWVADHLRDLGNERALMHNLFKGELEKRDIPFTLVIGNYEKRVAFVKGEIERMLSE